MTTARTGFRMPARRARKKTPTQAARLKTSDGRRLAKTE